MPAAIAKRILLEEEHVAAARVNIPEPVHWVKVWNVGRIPLL